MPFERVGGELLFGGTDMAAELRVAPTWDALLYARSRLVHAAAEAQVDLIDVPWLDLEDMDGLEREAARCTELGMTGKGAIPPKQLPIIERHFSPSAEQAVTSTLHGRFKSAGGSRAVGMGPLES